MAHDHDHAHDTDTYYLDQLCMIGLTGAFAGICLTMYFLNRQMLTLLLAYFPASTFKERLAVAHAALARLWLRGDSRVPRQVSYNDSSRPPVVKTAWDTPAS